MQCERSYRDKSYVDTLMFRFEAKMAPRFANKQPYRAYFRETIQFDSLPPQPVPAQDDNDGEADDLSELAKTCRFYEQANYAGELYKLGDFVYVKYQKLSENQPSSRDEFKLPLIVRIDRLWAHKGDESTFFMRGPVFLRSTDIPHEPTRMFYKNEVSTIIFYVSLMNISWIFYMVYFI